MKIKNLFENAAIAAGFMTTLEILGVSDFTRQDEKCLFNAHSKSFANIEIVGDRDFISTTEKALAYVKDNDPKTYSFVTNNIHKIKNHKRIFGVPIRTTGTNVWTGEFNVGDETPYTGAIPYAGVLAHEACHVELYNTGKTYMGEAAERVCIIRQNKTRSNLGLYELNVENTLATKYWKNLVRTY